MFEKLLNFFSKNRKPTFETERLILRSWERADAQYVFNYAQNPEIALNSGWQPHQSIEDSKNFIDFARSNRHTYAIVSKRLNQPIGSISLMIGSESNFEIPNKDGEIGFWIGQQYWGNGFVQEAAQALIDFGFKVLNLKKIWCGYFEGNERSKRVQEKIGFKPHHSLYNTYWKPLDEVKTEHVSLMTKEDYLNEIQNNCN